MSKGTYRKINDRTQNSSTYHKKDGTNIRAKLKKDLQSEPPYLQLCKHCKGARTVTLPRGY